VDPTRYLQSWPRPDKLSPPLPVHPRLPLSAAWRHEATVNFGELLAARGLVHHPVAAAPTAPLAGGERVPHGMNLEVTAAPAPAVGGRASSIGTVVWGAVDAAFALAALIAFAVWWRRARNAEDVQP
jgi:hypothetical protein